MFSNAHLSQRISVKNGASSAKSAARDRKVQVKGHSNTRIYTAIGGLSIAFTQDKVLICS